MLRTLSIISRALILSFILTGCVGSNHNDSTVTPYPYPPQTIQYESPPIFQLPNFQVYDGNLPSSIGGSISNYNSHNLGIAYSDSNSAGKGNAAAVNLTAMLTTTSGTNTYLCTATPINYNPDRGETTFVTAAHCVINQKSLPNSIATSDITTTSRTRMWQGLIPDLSSSFFSVVATYVPQNYCYGVTFPAGSECPLFYYTDNSTQQNDIAVVVVSGQFSTNANYPQIIPLQQYPTPYTWAPILSLGYGTVNNAQGKPILINKQPRLFYITDYYYMLDDRPGYHHMYNSFFNASANGYTTLFCNGDSGGPDLFWDGHHWDLLSEHTSGPAGVCGGFVNNLANGNVSTRVGDYYQWITDIESHRSAGDNYCTDTQTYPNSNCTVVTSS